MARIEGDITNDGQELYRIIYRLENRILTLQDEAKVREAEFARRLKTEQEHYEGIILALKLKVQRLEALPPEYWEKL